MPKPVRFTYVLAFRGWTLKKVLINRYLMHLMSETPVHNPFSIPHFFLLQLAT